LFEEIGWQDTNKNTTYGAFSERHRVLVAVNRHQMGFNLWDVKLLRMCWLSDETNVVNDRTPTEVDTQVVTNVLRKGKRIKKSTRLADYDYSQDERLGLY